MPPIPHTDLDSRGRTVEELERSSHQGLRPHCAYHAKNIEELFCLISVRPLRFSLPRRPDAIHALDDIGPPLLVAIDNDFGITRGPELIASRDKLLADLAKIVHFSVEDDDLDLLSER